jgi:hypothetical protein
MAADMSAIDIPTEIRLRFFTLFSPDFHRSAERLNAQKVVIHTLGLVVERTLTETKLKVCGLAWATSEHFRHA